MSKRQNRELKSIKGKLVRFPIITNYKVIKIIVITNYNLPLKNYKPSFSTATTLPALRHHIRDCRDTTLLIKV